MENTPDSTPENAAGDAVLAPMAKKIPKTMTLHGDVRVDDYAWMRIKADPDLMPHLAAEDRFADAYMQDTAALQTTLYDEMRGRIKEADQSVPFKGGRWLYFTRTEEGKQYDVHCRRLDQEGSAEEVLLDVNELAKDVQFFAVGTTAISPDGNLFAYTFDNLGNENYRLVVKDLNTGKNLSSTADLVSSIAWASDNETIFYTTLEGETKRSNQLHRHTVGSGVHSLIHDESDELFEIQVIRSRSGSFLYLETVSKTTATVSCIRADQPLSQFEEILPRRQQIRYTVADDRFNFYILTNLDAKDFRLLKAPCHSPADWQEILPHRLGVLLTSMEVFADFLVVHELDYGVPQVRVQQLANGRIRYVRFPERVYDVEGGDNSEFYAGTYRLIYESPVTPPSTLDYDVQADRFKVLKTKEVKAYKPADYHCERIFATASDGTQVPMTVIYKLDNGHFNRDGSHPCHLYGYGSYGTSISAFFSVARLSLLDRGFVYAIAHVRGGGELGEAWREDGRLKKKMNTFTDFIACAQHLIKEGYADRLSMEGRSAGGLLMGAVLNLAPNLFKAAIAEVPFVDVLTTMLDKSLPLTVGEFEEWGDPNVAEDYKVMRAYSPYDNVAAHNYPAILVRSYLHDIRVGFWEPAKWVAKLRATKTNNNPLIFKIMLEVGGHGGSSGRFDRLKEVAFDYAFLLKQVGVK